MTDKSAKEIAGFLSDLSDRLVIDGLEPDSDDFWAAWFDATRSSITRLGEKVKVVIKTPAFDIEIKGGES